LGLMDRIKTILLKPKAGTVETSEQNTVIPTTPTRYGKWLQLSTAQKSELVESLTHREKEAFFALLGGYSLKETAKQLGIGYSTANTYQTAIYRKLHVNSRAELIINYRDICGVQEDGS
jgi:DNA-binding CsgD family transcriptional regulator